MNLKFLGYSSIAFGVFMVRCEIFFWNPTITWGQTIKFSGDEQLCECTFSFDKKPTETKPRKLIVVKFTKSKVSQQKEQTTNEVCNNISKHKQGNWTPNTGLSNTSD